MDRLVRSPQIGRAPFSPLSRQNMSSNKSLSSSFRKSSRMSVSGRSAQSVQILSSRNNYVERFGNPLPVHVTETLNHEDRNTYARIFENGFAWVVRGRRLLIWQYRCREPQQRRGGPLNHCYELQLPQSDIAHRAELVSVTINSDNSNSINPACMTVSPSGSVRFWPDVGHDDNFIDQQVTVQLEKCDSLTDTHGNGWVLTTTSRTVMVLRPFFTNGRYQLQSECLRAPSGWFDRFGKRMSSFIFGSSDSYISENSGFLHVLSTVNRDGGSNVYVMSDLCLQKWQLGSNCDLLYIVDLNRLIIEAFPRNLWDNRDHNEIDVKLLDLQNVGDCVVMLVAANNSQVSTRMNYAMVWVQTNTSAPPNTLKAFRIIKIPEFYETSEGEAKNDTPSYKLLINEGDAFIYNQKAINVIRDGEDVDTLVFDNPGHFILAGNFCFNTPIFFLNFEGLVSVYSKDMPADISLNVTNNMLVNERSFVDNGVINNLSIYNMDPDDMIESHQGILGQLKGAFIYHVKNEQCACREILDEIFPLDGANKLMAIDSALDKTVVMLAKDLLNDKPSGDARWDDEIPLGVGSSYSMHIIHQLQGKQRAFSLFVKFLKETGLWERLSVCFIRNTNLATVFVLSELSEKIVAALALKSSVRCENLLLKAIKKAVDDDLVANGTNGLTHQDHFYCEVDKIHRGLQELVNNLEDLCHSDADPSKIVEDITDTCAIYMNVIKDVMKFRNDNGALFIPSRQALSLAPDYLPWISANGTEGLVDYLVLLHFLIYNYGIKIMNNDRKREQLFEDLVGITDLLLDGRMRFIESIKGTAREKVAYKQFCSDRQKFLKPFVLEKKWDKAAVLAEKYLDFETLMRICDDPDNKLRLRDYETRFNHLGFSEFSCNWYLKENQQGKLLDRCREKVGSSDLKPIHDFLSNYPQLQWIQLLTDENYSEGAQVLKVVGDSEENSVTKQKTAYSLCKLATLADPIGRLDEDRLKAIDSRLLLIDFQEQIPDYVLQQVGYDVTNQRPLSPEELVHLYICKEYTEASEIEFEKALEITDFVDDFETKHQLILSIWRSAIARDSWKHSQNLDNPIEILQDKLFFKIVDIASSFDRDVISILPPIDVLLDDESLADIQNDKTVDFLLRAGYEYIYRMKS